MPEHLFRFLLSELKVVRLRCKEPGCGVVTDVDLATAGGRRLEGCPICRHPFQNPPDGHTMYYSMSDMLRAMHSIALSDKVDVEFVLPQD
jgi:hypothetical protein